MNLLLASAAFLSMRFRPPYQILFIKFTFFATVGVETLRRRRQKNASFSLPGVKLDGQDGSGHAPRQQAVSSLPWVGQ